MGEEFKVIFEKIAAVVAALAGAILAFGKTRDAVMGFFNLKPLLRKSIKADIELLKLMEKTDPGYEELKNHIKSQLVKMIRKEEKVEILKKDWIRRLVGLLMAVGFGYWTYHISRNPGISNWWAILTVWMTLAGIGFLIKTSASTERSPVNNKAGRSGRKERKKIGDRLETRPEKLP
jgi:hypothetical protein